METLYQILGVPEDAPTSVIKQRFQQLIIEHHPDKRSSSLPGEDRAHHILQAWNVLRDNSKRKLYDIELQASSQKQKLTINADIDLDEMDYDEVQHTYTLMCRCSGSYAITENDLELGNDVICCDNCSLRIRVLYDVINDSEGDD